MPKSISNVATFRDQPMSADFVRRKIQNDSAAISMFNSSLNLQWLIKSYLWNVKTTYQLWIRGDTGSCRDSSLTHKYRNILKDCLWTAGHCTNDYWLSYELLVNAKFRPISFSDMFWWSRPLSSREEATRSLTCPRNDQKFDKNNFKSLKWIDSFQAVIL